MQASVTIYTQPLAARQAMYDDCAAAQSVIFLEQYIMCDDTEAQRFLTLLADKARAGVKVRILFDKVGSKALYASSLVADIRAAGGHVRFYNDIGWFHLLLPWRWFPRDHIKLLMVDDDIAYVGSMCLGEYMAGWYDIVARLCGPHGRAVQEDYRAAPKKAIALRKALPGRLPDGLADRTRPFRYLMSVPSLRVAPAYRELLQRLYNAQRQICIVTPYFVPPRRLRAALLRAARRGVDVRVIVTDKTDEPAAHAVSRSYFPRLIRKGIRIFAYQGTVCHAKYAVVDGEWAMLGSTNLDYLSLAYNREGDLIVTDAKTVTAVQALFDAALENAVALGPDFWDKAALREKIVGYCGRIFKKIL